MKTRIKSSFFVFAICLFANCAELAKPDLKVNIPDNNFLNLLINKGFDLNGDGTIDEKEAAMIHSLDVSEDSISDLSGIEYFVSLDSLNCNSNNLTSLNISNNTSLKYLDCSYNEIAELDVLNNIQLVYLNCSGNGIWHLDVSKNPNLINLVCRQNNIQDLDCNYNTELEELDCCFNRLSSLNVTKSTKLKFLDTGCFTNQLTSLDVSNNPVLETLLCCCNELRYLDISNNQLLKFLSISNNPWSSDSFLTVCVWEMPFPLANMKVQDDQTVKYIMNCN